ncbi:hypothetical protein N9L76_00790 [bacterium]|nr:hypothetical protein [bacterium]
MCEFAPARAIWTEETSVGSTEAWLSISSSIDGTKLAAVINNGSIWTYDTNCYASTDTSKDGTDGTFYCINGGTIGGSVGACTCTSCDTGYSGTSCQTASVCSASSTSSDDGSDGSFYCINGGTAGGVTGSCTSCDAGYEGTNCHTAILCAASKALSRTRVPPERQTPPVTTRVDQTPCVRRRPQHIYRRSVSS